MKTGIEIIDYSYFFVVVLFFFPPIQYLDSTRFLIWFVVFAYNDRWKSLSYISNMRLQVQVISLSGAEGLCCLFSVGNFAKLVFQKHTHLR